ncbi:NYN domain-containing protein [Nevskia ramosa]|uniref:NYN domain-containing protein n=1 Tax=Nevskia ramosa TaxID=64002 RepID=UPI003D132BF3
MTIPRSIAFVDGENLVMRYQAMVNSGRTPRDDVIHELDCFVWHPGATKWSMFDFIRINYYTSTTGDMPKIDALKHVICATEYAYSYTHVSGVPDGEAYLVPHVFHKPSKNTKARNVDLQISIDVLRAAHLNAPEMLLILSGDGDYIPLIQEAARHGKEIWLGAFSSGLNPRLKHHVDVFFELDDIFFLAAK